MNTKQVRRMLKIRDDLFNMANSLAGERTGVVAALLHAGANEVTRAVEYYKYLSENKDEKEVRRRDVAN